MCSARDTAHVSLVCSFACALPLWSKRVVACRVSLSCISSVCAKLLLVESRFPDLFFVTVSLGYTRFFNEHTRLSLLMFLVDQILLSCTNNLPLLIFCAMSISALLMVTVLRTPSQVHTALSCSTVIEHTPANKAPFIFR